MRAFTGTGALVRFVLRRDRWVLPVWIAVAVLVPFSLASGAADLYPTAEALRDYTEEAMSNPAQIAMRGLIYAPTLGGVSAWGAGMSSALVFTIASLLIVVRHTRAEEETGRLEILGSTGVGRHANLTATSIVVIGANLVAGVLFAAGLIGIGLPPDGSLVLGLSSAAVGVSIGAVAACAAQLTPSSGSARGIAFGSLAILFALRAAGDVQADSLSWLSWLSPFGWARLTEAYAGDRWWVFGLFALFIAVFLAAAYALSSRRDISAGLLPETRGPERAPASLRSVLALAWRTHRGTLLAWSVAYAVLGLLIGLAAGGDSTEQFGGLFTGADALQTFTLLVLSQATAGYAILTALRGGTEENRGLAELLLASAPRRVRWAGAHLIFAVIGPVLLLGLAGLGMAIATGNPAVIPAALIWLPAVWTIAATALALWGWLPRLAAPVAWALLVIFLLIELAYEFGQLNQAALDLSPFTHIPRVLLGADISPAPITILLAITAGLTTTGLIGIRRRDIG
ncbi:ABC transporter permease [Nonomuraea sp. KC401]|uniref:ABC transporter permease n=1 Tax=unclassified Nonomuraea TaxID=2593643 RepID=UPI0010FF58B7|nr:MULTISPECIES: ABC transporter permease [unclassified Nonomuraea]NBE98123.1 ABC transporter permease [Nonomuraea sp. K271]TLF60428.1 ABC transporter permease [Nonomuraea sp. KC401]